MGESPPLYTIDKKRESKVFLLKLRARNRQMLTSTTVALVFVQALGKILA